MDASSDEVLVAGECPVCPGVGAAVMVASVESAEIFFACPDCGCAWRTPPSGAVDSVDPPSRFAPAGFRLAHRKDVETAGLLPLFVRTEPLAGGSGDFEGIDGFVAGAEAG